MQYEDFSLFLLGNLTAYGLKLTEDPYSGNFKLVRRGGQVVAVFCFSSRGNLLVQSEIADDVFFEALIASCREEKIPLAGLLGEWDLCSKLWKVFKGRSIIGKETYLSKEILYAVNLAEHSLPQQGDSRLLTPEDYV